MGDSEIAPTKMTSHAGNRVSVRRFDISIGSRRWLLPFAGLLLSSAFVGGNQSPNNLKKSYEINVNLLAITGTFSY